jgi:CDP-glucose 4,6-dehydratase
VRPWQHVLDVLSGYLTVVDELVHSKGQEPWNFGPSGADAFTVADVAERIGLMFGTDPPWTKDPLPQPQEAAVLTLDSAKARSRLGWRPRLGIDEALSWTVAWYRLAETVGARAATTTQIDGFADLVRDVTPD